MIKKSHRIPLITFLVVLIISFVLFRDVFFKSDGFSRKEISKNKSEQPADKRAKYAGKAECISCHQRQHHLWLGSDHDMAMMMANDSTIVGDFNNTEFTIYGVTSKFYKRAGKFYVETEGLSGQLEEFEINFTFGIRPLQQYLVKFPDGRVQVLPICWDNRPAKSGGQCWFHIYPDEKIAPDDVLFWMRMNQNWNFMCAECHSTDVRKNYNVEDDTYETTYSEINVACESCHGPGSEHISWAKMYQENNKSVEKGDMGLEVRLKYADQGNWVFDTGTSSARRTKPLESDVLVEMCARCHSRRTAITDDYIHGQNLLNTHRPRLLEEGLYFSDGQILEEVYVYDSFLQSKMYQKGVICTDCHEPHSAKTYANDNTLCYRCHLHNTYGTKSHHFHNPDSSGASCVECHMPERTYMVVDPRRDHSIRIPRSDLSDKLETPNACNKCHSDKSVQWAVNAIKKWYGNDFVNQSHYGNIFHAARKSIPWSQDSLFAMVYDEDQPAIIRASALLELRRFPIPELVQTIGEMVNHQNTLIRFAAVQISDIIEIDNRWQLLKPLLSDSLGVIRLEAAGKLTSVPRHRLTGNDNKLLDRVIDEYIGSQLYNGDRPSSHLNLGVLYLNKKDYAAAEASYKKAIVLEPGLPYPYINLSDLYRIQERDDIGEEVLKSGINYIRNNADLHYALGLLFVRQKRIDEALENLKISYEINPENENVSYAYAVGLNSVKKSEQAIEILELSHKSNPYNNRILEALAMFNRDQNNMKEALKYTKILIDLYPENRGYRSLLEELRGINGQ